VKGLTAVRGTLRCLSTEFEVGLQNLADQSKYELDTPDSHPMWHPTKLGRVIAERTLLFKRRGKRSRTVHVRFGQPVRRRGGPWHCPVQMTGLGPKRVVAFAGEDSLQSLVLALEFVTLSLPAEARRAGGQVDWLDETESPVFAGTFMLNAYARALGTLLKGIRSAVAFIEGGSGDRKRRSQQVVRRLQRLAKTWGLRLTRKA